MLQLNKDTVSKITEVLQLLYDSVDSEEKGYTVRLSEVFSTKELKKLFKEARIPSPSNLSAADMNEAIKDFLEDNPNMAIYDVKIINAWLSNTNLNSAAKRIFRSKVKNILDKSH